MSYIRGRSIANQFMIIDEAQNLTPLEVKTIITRVGHGTKIIFTGDPYQIDNPYVDSSSNGFNYIVSRFRSEADRRAHRVAKGRALGTGGAGGEYSVISFLRCLGVLNAAVWFGSAMFFTFAAAPAVFSTDMQRLLGGNNYPYFSGAIAQIIFSHFFLIQMICSIIALSHLLCERLYFGRSEPWRGPLLVFLIVMTLLGGFVVRPRLRDLHKIKYAPNTTPEMREAANQSFRTWHGASQITNVFVLIALGTYVCRLGHRPE